MPVKTTGAEVVSSTEKATLVRIHWRDGGERGASLRIVHPYSFIERFLFRQDRLSPRVLKRVSLTAYLLIPVLIFLNTVVAHIQGVPYAAVLTLTAVILAVALASGVWFFFGAGLVDRLQGDPLRAMKAPGVPAPDWWVGREGEITDEGVRAFQRAYLAREADAERAREGEVLRGQFSPGQESHRALTLGLGHLAEHKRHLTELLAAESLDAAHVKEMRRVAEELSIPTKIATSPIAEEVRDWVRNV